MSHSLLPSLLACALFGAAAIGCGSREEVPPPKSALEAYLKAVSKQDAGALREMMTKEAREQYSEQQLAELLERDQEEFAERGQSLSDSQGRGRATVFLTGGRRVALSLDDGEFSVQSAGIVPAQPHTPEEAVQLLREAVLARDYHRIEQALTDDAREEFSRAFERMDLSLEQLDTAIVDVRQDRATVEFVDGRVIVLRRQGLVWRVEEFE